MSQFDPSGFAFFAALAAALGAFPRGSKRRFLKSTAVFVPTFVASAYAAAYGGFVGLLLVGGAAWALGRVIAARLGDIQNPR